MKSGPEPHASRGDKEPVSAAAHVAQVQLPVAVLDYEASSLSDNSYPIEAGWAIITSDLSVSSGSILIRPHRRWADWSRTSERIHGLSREALIEEGIDCRTVAERLGTLFGELPGPVLSADPDYESFWSDRLYKAVGIERSWLVGSLNAVLAVELGRLDADQQAAIGRTLAAPRPHRAEPDSKLLATVLASLLKPATDR